MSTSQSHEDTCSMKKLELSTEPMHPASHLSLYLQVRWLLSHPERPPGPCSWSQSDQGSQPAHTTPAPNATESLVGFLPISFGLSPPRIVTLETPAAAVLVNAPGAQAGTDQRGECPREWCSSHQGCLIEGLFFFKQHVVGSTFHSLPRTILLQFLTWQEAQNDGKALEIVRS